MKKFLLTVTITLALCLIASITFAAFPTTPTTVGVSASIDSIEEFTLTLYQGDSAGNIDWSSAPGSMNFGALEPVDPTQGYNSLCSRVFYAVAVGVKYNGGSPGYTVKYEGAPLIHDDGVTTLSDDCWTIKVMRMLDSKGATLPAPGSFDSLYLNKTYHANSTSNSLYADSSGRGASFISYFGVTGDPSQSVHGTSSVLIPPDQKIGPYSANVKFTITKP